MGAVSEGSRPHPPLPLLITHALSAVARWAHSSSHVGGLEAPHPRVRLVTFNPRPPGQISAQILATEVNPAGGQDPGPRQVHP